MLAGHIRQTLLGSIITNRINIIASAVEFARYAPQITSYDIILTDLSLVQNEHDFWWYKIIEHITKKSPNIPIIVMSWYGDIDTLRHAFELGATDYLIKPFRLKELEVRVHHWFQRYCFQKAEKEKHYYMQSWIGYDMKKNEFYKSKVIIPLSRTQKYIFSLFFANPNTILTQEFLREKIWWDHDESPERNLRIVILRLRRILATYGLDKALITVRAEGYLFDTSLIE